MTPGEKQTLLEIVDELEPDRDPLSGFEAERRAIAVLKPLLTADGYAVQPARRRDGEPDLFAVRESSERHERQELVVEVKYRRSRRSLRLDDVGHSVVYATAQRDAARVIVLANTGFSQRLRDEVTHRLPVEVELLGLDDLRTWISRIDSTEEDIDAEAAIIVQDLASRFASIIARNPRALDRIEWRDLERIIAEIFRGLGFDVELTPPAKDGGKDVVLQCLVRGARHSYIVEVKHWRSGTRVGSSAVREFVDVVAREARQGGVFLSSSGYTENAFELLTEIERQSVRFGGEEKIAALCRKYTRAGAGLWSPPEILPEVVFEGTE